MAIDIAAIQHMYGANLGHHAGSTAYQLTDPGTKALDLDGNSDGLVSIGRAYYCIWDAGQFDTDTIRYDGAKRAIINLNDATLSSALSESDREWLDDLRGTAEFGALSANAKSIFDEATFAGGIFSGLMENNDLIHGGYSIAKGGKIENASGDQGADILIGNELDNELRGNGSSDLLIGARGSDKLHGGAGRDTLIGGAVNDGSAIDTAYYIGSWQNYTLKPGSISGQYLLSDLTGNDGTDTLIEIDKLKFANLPSAITFEEFRTLQNGVNNVAATGTNTAAPTPQAVVQQSSDKIGQSASTASSITPGGPWIEGTIDHVGDQDWYQFSVDQGQVYGLLLLGSSSTGTKLADPFLRVVNSNGLTIYQNDDGGGGTSSLITFTAGTTGSFYASAQGVGSGKGGYSLTLVEANAPITTPPAPHATPVVQVTKPDLSVSSFELPSTAVMTGTTRTVNVDLSNSGGAVSGDEFRVSIYLSTNSQVTTSDSRIGSVDVSNISANGAIDLAIAARFGAGLTPGTYWIGAIADLLNAIGETRETNNASAPVQITVAGEFRGDGLPDLSANHLTVSTPPLTPGQLEGVSFQYHTDGTPAPQSEAALFLSRDALLSENDTQLAIYTLDSLGAFGSKTFNGTFTLPVSQDEGVYSLIVSMDHPNAVNESREYGNTTVEPFVVTNATADANTHPDFIVDNVTTTDNTVEVGQEVTLLWHFANASPDDASPNRLAAPFLTTRLYLSADEVLSIDDRVLNEQKVINMTAGRVYDAGVIRTIPTDLAPGQYWLIAEADSGHVEAEDDETNNVSGAVPIYVSVPVPTGANGQWGSGADDFFVANLNPDFFVGTGGSDTVTYIDAPTGISVNLSGTQIGSFAGGDTFSSIERIMGSLFDDALTAGTTAIEFSGLDGDDTIMGSTVADTLWGGADDDHVMGGSGNDDINGGEGEDLLTGGVGIDTLTGGIGTDRFADTLAGLDGDAINDFGMDDEIYLIDVITQITNVSLSGEPQKLGIDINGDGQREATLTFDEKLDGGELMAVALDGGTVMTFESYLPTLGETKTVAEDDVNGVANEYFLTASSATTFEISVNAIAEAGFHNTLGVYEVAKDGTITNARILFDDVKSGSGLPVTVSGVAEGSQLGFFIVQNGASWADTLSASDTLSFVDQNGAALTANSSGTATLSLNGAATDQTVFHSLNSTMNGDGVQHVLSGVDLGGETMTLGFEDLTGGGDRDYQDVVVTIARQEVDLLV